MTVLDDFYAGYLHYTVAYRLWIDTCRQLADCNGTLDERQALVDETLRLSMCVAENIDDVESLLADTLEYLQSEETGDPDLPGAISLIANNLKEDRARADDYTRFVMRRRSGGKEKRPRRPQIANPFVYVPEDVSGEEPLAEPEPDEAMEPVPAEDVSENTVSEEVRQDQSDNPLAEESERMAEEQRGREQKPERKGIVWGRGK